jgi:hypothetical protein
VKGAGKKVNSRIAKWVELGRSNLEKIRRECLLKLGVSRNRKMPHWPFSREQKHTQSPYLPSECNCIPLKNKELIWFRQMTFLSHVNN